jgi:hypothetical protein
LFFLRSLIWWLIFGVLLESICLSLGPSDVGVISFLSGWILGCVSALCWEIG